MTENNKKIRDARQLYLFEENIVEYKLDSRFWHGSFNKKESTIQQLSPYVGKMKSGMAKVLLELYSSPGDIVLDPFSGSGVVPFEAVLAKREALANDLSPYAYTLTRGKLETPDNLKMALDKANQIIEIVEKKAAEVDLTPIPDWVKDFYHPKTLQEIIVAFDLLLAENEYFLTSCLLGILHHVRPGFLSYPASHLVPYLRIKKFPPEEFPEMYEYRDIRSRLIAKVKRAYRRANLPNNWEDRKFEVWQENSMNLPIKPKTVDAIISSPPYFGALDYARDNRLRLWFLGCKDWKELDQSLTANNKVYLKEMAVCLKEFDRILKSKGYCVLVLGDVERNGKTRRTAEILAELTQEVTNDGFIIKTIYDDIIPDKRRSRRKTNTTKFERILVMRKK